MPYTVHSARWPVPAFLVGLSEGQLKDLRAWRRDCATASLLVADTCIPSWMHVSCHRGVSLRRDISWDTIYRRRHANPVLWSRRGRVLVISTSPVTSRAGDVRGPVMWNNLC